MDLYIVIIIANIIMTLLAAIKIEYIEKEIKEEIEILKKRNNYCEDEIIRLRKYIYYIKYTNYIKYTI